MNLSRIRLASIALAVTGVAALGLTPVSSAQTQSQTWLERTNAYRANVGLPPVVDAPEWTASLAEHTNYMMLAGAISHVQDPSKPGATPGGAVAAASSVVVGWGRQARTDADLVDEWIKAPFHGIHFFEPHWQKTTFFSRREPGRVPLDGVGALDVTRGVVPSTSRANRPITFPGDGTTVPVGDFVSDSPDPLTSCPGYSAPAGLPVMVLFPDPVSGARGELKADGVPVETCVFDSGSYRNPNPADETLGRDLLKQKNAVVIVPRTVLQPGVAYTATVTTATGSTSWSFKIVPGSVPTAGTPVTFSAPVSTKATKASSKTRTTKKTTKKTTVKKLLRCPSYRPQCPGYLGSGMS